MTLLDHQFLLSLPKRRGFTKCTINNDANIYTLGIPNKASKSGYTYFCGTDKGGENVIDTIYHDLKDYVERRIGTEREGKVKDLIPYIKRFERVFPGVLEKR